MSAPRDDLRIETRLGPHTVVVHYRAPLPAEPYRDEYMRAVAAAAEVYAGAMREQAVRQEQDAAQARQSLALARVGAPASIDRCRRGNARP